MPCGRGISHKQFIGKNCCGFHGFIAGTETFSPQVSQPSTLRKLDELIGIETPVSCLMTRSCGGSVTPAVCCVWLQTERRHTTPPNLAAPSLDTRCWWGSSGRHGSPRRHPGRSARSSCVQLTQPWLQSEDLLQKASCDWVEPAEEQDLGI